MQYTEQMYNEDIKIANYVFNRKFFKLQEEREDIISMFVAELWKKRKVFDPQKSKYITFAVLTCKHKGLQYVRYLKASKRNAIVCSLDDEVPNTGGLTIADMIGSNDNFSFESAYLKDIANNAFNSINDKKFKQAVYLYFNGNNQRDIATRVGISQAQVSRRLKKFKDLCKIGIENTQIA